MKVDEIMKTWPKNQAKNPQEAVGKELPVTGVFGKFLDVLIQVEKGDRIEIEAFHNSGAASNHPGRRFTYCSAGSAELIVDITTTARPSRPTI